MNRHGLVALSIAFGLALAAPARPLAADEPAESELVFGLSLDELFPDPDVRALARAAERGDVQEMERLVAQGVSVNARGVHGITPLFASMGKPGFEKLLELGADPNLRVGPEGFEMTVVHGLAASQYAHALQLVLDHGGDPDLLATMNGSVFHTLALAVTSVETVAVLVGAGADVDGSASSGEVAGTTPVVIAALLRQFDTVHYLLTQGADWTQRDALGQDLIGTLRRMDVREDELADEQAAAHLAVLAWLRERGAVVPDPLPALPPDEPDRSEPAQP